MKKIHSKKINKLIICIVTVIMLCNFAMPNFVYAADPGDGGKLLKGIAQFVAYITDKVMQWLQDSFVSKESIEQSDGSYKFQYTPAIIFSGTVPALSINFINPDSEESRATGYHWTAEGITQPDKLNWYYQHAQTIETGAELSALLEGVNSDAGYNYIHKTVTGTSETNSYLTYNRDYQIYYQDGSLIIGIKTTNTNTHGHGGNTSITYSYRYYQAGREYHQSTASKLHGTIATWYKTLRRIALVGLLSVLLYIGIRIVLTSTSPQNKSKYKAMLKDWLVALCLLFTLHYIMNLTITVTQEISKVFNTGETDTLMNTLRGDIKAGGNWGEVVGEVIEYAILLIFTIMFTFQYIKRVIYMAFFTMIAPLITLTYPLDKIKDGQAQAFTMWMREYVFNALIQVVHLVIYYVLVGSSLELVKSYPIYAIVALLFMKQAETIVKKMFGFDKAETVGSLGAAVTGGLVMNAVQSLAKPKKSKDDDDGEQEGNDNQNSGSQVRTANTDPLGGLRTAQSGANNTPQPQNTNEDKIPGVDYERAELFKKLRQEGMDQETAVNRVNAELPFDRNENNGNNNSNKTGRKRNVLNGVKAVAGKYIGKNIKPMMKTVAGGLLGATGATIGFASGVAQGDVGKAITGGIAGGAAGFYTGQKGVDFTDNAINAAVHIDEPIRDIIATFKEGSYGMENVEAILNVGITNRDEILKILENDDGDIEKTIGYYTLAKRCPKEIYDDDEKLEEYLKNLGLDETDAITMRDNMKKFR